MRGWLTFLLLALAEAPSMMAVSTTNSPQAVQPVQLTGVGSGLGHSPPSTPSLVSLAASRATNATRPSNTAVPAKVAVDGGRASATSTAITDTPTTTSAFTEGGASSTRKQPAAGVSASNQLHPVHAFSGPLLDDEDPPVSFPPSADDDQPLVTGWPARSVRGFNGSPEADDLNMEVRSNNPSGGHSIRADPPPEPHSSPSSSVPADDESRPSWRMVNTKRCGLSKNAFSDRIVGGALAALGQYPWLARIGYNMEGIPRRVYRCAGAVITHLHVLTAAHCVKNLPDNFEFAGVRLGEWDTTNDPDCQNSVCAPPVYDVDPESVIVHQDYNNPRFANDIALVKITQKINFDGWVAPVCIPFGNLLNKNYESERTEVAGWGIFDITLQKSSQELRTVNLPVVSNSICHALYRNQANITKKQLCAGGEIGSDACSGDSGGPLLKVEAYNGGPRYYIVGIVSFGSRRCGLTPSPGVYTRVSYYVDWILDNIDQV